MKVFKIKDKQINLEALKGVSKSDYLKIHGTTIEEWELIKDAVRTIPNKTIKTKVDKTS